MGLALVIAAAGCGGPAHTAGVPPPSYAPDAAGPVQPGPAPSASAPLKPADMPTAGEAPATHMENPVPAATIAK